jgi:hypothetical protein
VVIADNIVLPLHTHDTFADLVDGEVGTHPGGRCSSTPYPPPAMRRSMISPRASTAAKGWGKGARRRRCVRARLRLPGRARVASDVPRTPACNRLSNPGPSSAHWGPPNPHPDGPPEHAT